VAMRGLRFCVGDVAWGAWQAWLPRRGGLGCWGAGLGSRWAGLAATWLGWSQRIGVQPGVGAWSPPGGGWGANSGENRGCLARLPGGPGRRRWFAAGLCAFQGPEMAAWLAYGLRLGL